MLEQGRRFSSLQLVTHPLGAFLKMYVLRAGFLDGHARLDSFRTLWLLHRHEVREVLGTLEG